MVLFRVKEIVIGKETVVQNFYVPYSMRCRASKGSRVSTKGVRNGFINKCLEYNYTFNENGSFTITTGAGVDLPANAEVSLQVKSANELNLKFVIIDLKGDTFESPVIKVKESSEWTKFAAQLDAFKKAGFSNRPQGYSDRYFIRKSRQWKSNIGYTRSKRFKVIHIFGHFSSLKCLDLANDT